MKMVGSSWLLRLLLVFTLALGALCGNTGGGFRVFYFVQQWLGSYCNQRGTRCCYPPWGKASNDFTIYGLWPYDSDGSFPYNCAGAVFDEAPLKPMQDSLRKTWPSFTCPQIGRKFWLHEWNKHGTCSQSVLSQNAYFQAAINLKYKINLLQALARAGIRPNNQLYSLKSIKQAITRAFGFHPWVDCNHNVQGKSQIWQITLCVDRYGKKLVNCPYIPKGRIGCSSKIKYVPSGCITMYVARGQCHVEC